jgi:predicted SAM-dependent methyltransferase
MKELLKKIPFTTYIVRSIRKFRGITPDDLKIEYYAKKRDTDIQNYLKSEGNKYLQIGCQNHPMKGWLNADINPMHDEVILMDATKQFPIPDNIFDNVFTEHMIEHIGFKEGMFMVKECYRVMKTGGVIRISTPNLKFLIDLYKEPKSQIQQEYIQFSKKYFEDNRPMTDAVVINNFFRDWGHQFIHDFKTLEYILLQAGFKNIKQCEVYKSEHSVLQNLEKHALELGEEFNKLESIVVEAIK